MLNPEVAERRLKEFRSPKQQRSRVEKLPGKLKEIGLGLLGYRADGKRGAHWEDRDRFAAAAGRQMVAALCFLLAVSRGRSKTGWSGGRGSTILVRHGPGRVSARRPPYCCST